MNGISCIFKKEMARVLKDKKMVFSVFLLPVLIMVVIMTIVGSLADKMAKDIEEHIPVVCIQNEPESFREFLEAGGYALDVQSAASGEAQKQVKAKILAGETDLLIEFPEEFDGQIAGYQPGDAIPQIKTYYNPSEEYSNQAFQSVSGGVLEAYRQMLLAGRMGDTEATVIFTVNSDNDEVQIQDEEKAGGKALGTMLPYFITILLFAGAMGIGSDMIAGEKERGTMASLLVTPVNRTSIVLGKVFALMIISGLSSLVYVAVMVVSMPLMMTSMTGGAGSNLELSLNAQQIIMLGLLLIALAFLYAAIVALISVFAKSTKEAASYITPVYMIVLVLGLVTMFRTGGGNPYDYYIPLYNSALALQGILSHEVTAVQYAVTLLETFAAGGILTVLIAKAFKSEKIMAP